jgi:ADP-ribosylglycohydrolase
VTEKHIGGLAGIVPIVVHHRNEPEKAIEYALTHLSLTHRGPKMAAAGQLVAELLHELLAGGGLRETIDAAIERGGSPFLDHPFDRWESEADKRVIGRHLSPACYVDDSVPAVIHLARKHADDPEKALVANTMLGGDNAYRGAILGALLGAGNGEEAWPARWRDGLLHPPKLPTADGIPGTLPA